MKALSIRQPWAGAVALGWKDVENRTRMVGHRGRLLIHASSSLAQNFTDAEAKILDATGNPVPVLGTPGRPAAWQLGAIIGAVELRAAHRGCDGSCSDWADPGAVHHMLQDARPLVRPVPAYGRLGVWTPDPEVLDEVKDAWPR